MSEDVSNVSRLSVTVVLLACAVAVVVNLAFIANQMMGSAIQRSSIAVNQSTASVISEMNQAGRVSGPVAYKFITSALSHLKTLTIKYPLSGHGNSSDAETLLKHCASEFKVDVSSNTGAGYVVVLTEVSK